MNLNLRAKKKNSYDAIVVGTGISGGWATKELTEKGANNQTIQIVTPFFFSYISVDITGGSTNMSTKYRRYG